MPKGKKNVYKCRVCGHSIVTMDIDEGVTPFMIFCKAIKCCKGMMYSTFYNCDQTLPVNYVWFKPESLEGYSPEMVEHIKKGGLDLRIANRDEMFEGFGSE